MSARPHPIYALLKDKTALQNNPELVAILGGKKTAAQVLMQLAYASDRSATTQGWFAYLQETLCRQLKISESTLRRAIRWLEPICLETRQEVISRNPRRTRNHYRIDWERLEQRIDDFHTRAAAAAQQGEVVATRADIEAVFGDGDVATMAVKMTGNKKNTSAASTRPRGARRRSARPHRHIQRWKRSDRPWFAKPSSEEDENMDGYFAREVGRQNPIGELSYLKDYGYDDDFNPPSARRPEPGEPEALARSKFSDMPSWVIQWLTTEALTQPVQDLLVALAKADPKLPETMVMIARNIAQGRRNAPYWRKSA